MRNKTWKNKTKLGKWKSKIKNRKNNLVKPLNIQYFTLIFYIPFIYLYWEIISVSFFLPSFFFYFFKLWIFVFLWLIYQIFKKFCDFKAVKSFQIYTKTFFNMVHNILNLLEDKMLGFYIFLRYPGFQRKLQNCLTESVKIYFRLLNYREIFFLIYLFFFIDLQNYD